MAWTPRRPVSEPPATGAPPRLRPGRRWRQRAVPGRRRAGPGQRPLGSEASRRQMLLRCVCRRWCAGRRASWDRTTTTLTKPAPVAKCRSPWRAQGRRSNQTRPTMPRWLATSRFPVIAVMGAREAAMFRVARWTCASTTGPSCTGRNIQVERGTDLLARLSGLGARRHQRSLETSRGLVDVEGAPWSTLAAVRGEAMTGMGGDLRHAWGGGACGRGALWVVGGWPSGGRSAWWRVWGRSRVTGGVLFGSVAWLCCG